MSLKRQPRRFVKMFKPRFAALVESGRKVQTVRPVPKRRPVAGDIFDGRMWEGKPYRSRQVPLRTGWIRRVELVEITVHGIGVWDVERNEWTHDEFVPSDFARADGFESWEEMRDWFRAEHDLPFRGVLIVWDPRDEIARAAEVFEPPAPSPHGNCCYCGVRLEREGIPYIDGLACDVCDARNV